MAPHLKEYIIPKRRGECIQITTNKLKSLYVVKTRYLKFEMRFLIARIVKRKKKKLYGGGSI